LSLCANMKIVFVNIWLFCSDVRFYSKIIWSFCYMTMSNNIINFCTLNVNGNELSTTRVMFINFIKNNFTTTHMNKKFKPLHTQFSFLYMMRNISHKYISFFTFIFTILLKSEYKVNYYNNRNQYMVCNVRRICNIYIVNMKVRIKTYLCPKFHPPTWVISMTTKTLIIWLFFNKTFTFVIKVCFLQKYNWTILIVYPL
jgi:hypothetical protein